LKPLALGEAEAELDRDEVLAADDLRRELLRLGADLRALHKMARKLAMHLRIAVVFVAVLPGGAEQKVHDVQAEADVAGAGLLVEEAAGGDAADVALFADLRLQSGCVDDDQLVGFGHGRRFILGQRGAGGQAEAEYREGIAHRGGSWSRGDARRGYFRCSFYTRQAPPA
jgi:hypothetical protein